MPSKRESRILKLLNEKEGRTLSEGGILRELGLSERKRKNLRATLKSMAVEGKLKRDHRGRYRFRGLRKDTRRTDRSNGGNSASLPKGSRKKTGPNGFSGRMDLRVLAELREANGGFVACPRRAEIPECQIESQDKRNGFREGDLVVIEARLGRKSARVIEHLGRSGEIETEKKGIISEYGLSETFSPSVTKEVGELREELSNGNLSTRKNLEKQTIFTIDGEDAKDFDDAVGIKKIREGYRLWVSIADVSHYVAPGSACDQEAARRTTSTYLSDRVIPMLPEKLSNDLCSLRPEKRRLTKTVEINFDSSGRLKDSRIYNSVIKSSARLTYCEVAAVLSGGSSSRGKNIVSSLLLMRELYHKLRERRIGNGGLDFDFPDAVLLRDSTGEVRGVDRSKRNVAHEIIEEFMIMANSVVAEFVFTNGFESIYRIHEPPDPDSIEQLRENLLKIGIKANFGSKVRQPDIQAVMKAASGRKNREQINFMILRALKKAAYSTKHVPHFGLAIDDYTHFTSPIRRYSDLVVHRIIDDILGKKPPFYNSSSLGLIAERCSIFERTAEDAERQFMNLETANFMKSRVGEVFHGKVLSIHPFGVFVEIEEHFVEGLIPEHFYKIRGTKRKWFELGEEVRVKLVSADMGKRRLTFDLASRQSSSVR
ncbi:MAG: VacB/RNase II family 3'-5' exoribonuclease [Candidatus Dadabacteria bacterium]|nr:VacB/RNase II family 3'-5' exoribonuclease [Candidatus Dadabacteria bacterium]